MISPLFLLYRAQGFMPPTLPRQMAGNMLLALMLWEIWSDPFRQASQTGPPISQAVARHATPAPVATLMADLLQPWRTPSSGKPCWPNDQFSIEIPCCHGYQQ